jgi:hypothetical protein
MVDSGIKERKEEHRIPASIYEKRKKSEETYMKKGTIWEGGTKKKKREGIIYSLL